MILPCAPPLLTDPELVNQNWVFEYVRCLVQATSDNVTNGTDYLNTAINGIQANILQRQTENYVNLYNQIGSTSGSISQQINGVFTSLNNIQNNLTSSVQTAISNQSSSINNYTGAVGQWLDDRNTDQTDQISDYVGLVGTWLNNNNTSQTSQISNQISSIYSSLQSQIENINTGTGATTGQIAATLRNELQTQSSGINTRINTLQNSINTMLNSNSSSINTSINIARDFLNNQINTIKNSVSNNLSGFYTALSDAVSSQTRNINTQAGLNTAGIKGDIHQARFDILEEIEKLDIDYGGLFEASLFNAIGNLFGLPVGWQEELEPLGDIIGKPIKDQIDNVTNSIEQQLQLVKEFIDRLISGEFQTWDEFISAWNDISKSQGIIVPLLALVSFPSILTSLAKFWSAPFLDHINQLSNEKSRSGLYSLSDSITLLRRGFLTGNDFHDNLAKLGFSDDKIAAYFSGMRPTIEPMVAREALLRHFIDNEQHDKFLEQTGLSEELINLYKLTYSQLPPISDLIRMMVREVFTPEITSLFGQFEDYPPQATEFAAQQGLSEDWMKSYWAAHWDLPSATQGYQMLHRRIINSNDLDTLLKALDYMPFWREKLKDLSFNPLTRVDVRRMFGTGVLNEQEVYEAYLDLGYNDVNALRMTEFTKRYTLDDEGIAVRELARSNIERAVKLGLITREDGLTRLQNLDYSEGDANLLLDLATYSQVTDLSEKYFTNTTNAVIREVIEGYKFRLISGEQTREYLNDYGLSEPTVELMLALADFEYSQALKKQVLSITREGYMNNTFTEVEFRETLTSNGFTINEIEKQILDLNKLKNLRVKPLTRPQYFAAWSSGALDTDTLISKLMGLGYSNESIIYMLVTEGVPPDE
jgi:hypothetical protein